MQITFDASKQTHLMEGLMGRAGVVISSLQFSEDTILFLSGDMQK